MHSPSIIIFDKFRGRKLKDIPRSYLKWLIRKSKFQHNISQSLKKGIITELKVKYANLDSHGRCKLIKKGYVLKKDVAGFIQKNQYPSPMNALRSEWGAAGNLRFLISSIGSETLNGSLLNANVYNIFCVGMEAYACIEQDGYSASFIYRPPIYDGPLALNASVGYKFAEVPRITNDLWVNNLRCTLA